jgi:hypothetical protein
VIDGGDCGGLGLHVEDTKAVATPLSRFQGGRRRTRPDRGGDAQRRTPEVRAVSGLGLVMLQSHLWLFYSPKAKESFISFSFLLCCLRVYF